MLKYIIIAVVFFVLGMLIMRLADKHYGCYIVVQPKERLLYLANGFLISRGLHVIAEFQIADQLLDGPKKAQEIAENLGIHPEATYRLLRMLAAHGIFEHLTNDIFALNNISELLTTQHPESLHNFLRYEDESRWQAYGSMAYTIKSGKPAFNYLFNEGYFEYIGKDSQRSAQFDKGMAAISAEESEAIARTIDFSNYASIVDIGGGVGGLLMALGNKYSSATLVLYELPHVAELAKKHIAQHALGSVIQVIEGSFFESIFPGADAYILKRVLHDWDDQVCINILRNCYKAMTNSARLIIFDCVVPDGNLYDISKDIDIVMMTIFGGKERTRKDFETILYAAGFTLLEIAPVHGTMLSMISAVK